MASVFVLFVLLAVAAAGAEEPSKASHAYATLLDRSSTGELEVVSRTGLWDRLATTVITII